MLDAPDAGRARKRSRRWLLMAGIVLAALLIWSLPWIWLAVRVGAGLAGLRPSGRITISDETTRVTEPIGNDGYVDYFRALNERIGEGATPENNAVVLLWKALGPAEIASVYGEEECNWYFQQLGVPRPPAEGEYFVSLYDYAQQPRPARPAPEQQRSDDQQPGQDEGSWQQWYNILFARSNEACKRPWPKEEFPELAAWLERNETPLRLLTAASRRERFYAPLIVPKQRPPVTSAQPPGGPQMRRAGAALAMRAMLRLEQGKTEEAWQDLLAYHRLARLVGQGPTIIDLMVAIGMERIACCADAAVAQHGNLTSEQALRFQHELREIGPLPSWVVRIDLGERLGFLDSATTMAKEGADAFRDTAGSTSEENWLQSELSARWANALIDWDEILRTGNAFYDQLVESIRFVDRHEQPEALDDLCAEIVIECEGSRDSEPLAQSFLRRGPRRTATKNLAEDMLVLNAIVLFPALEADVGALMRLQMTEVALALAGYRADHGSFPEDLEQLVPDYLDEVPEDLFSGGRLQYQSSGRDYLLYSVGRNREDDQGRTDDSQPSGDDIVIRTRQPEPPDD